MQKRRKKNSTVTSTREINSKVFKLTASELGIILLRAGVIENQFWRGGTALKYREKNKLCPPKKILDAKKITDGKRTFYVLFQKARGKMTYGICTIYRAK
ncbi:MAG: hypothetical protein US30_C0008G0052 [Candidatus Moranbacteria bacterium GW2011_GWF2_36_839]|nr:MAG: hypothetical protein US27_C0008G0052 [Candidatus Moranbacteria bacterium GW2011_GWF1_36_78]KKQ17034.1 MAG: hypothetical protein US30_C0008G0052 [Candidatus Moranbacteria bacterium GW2011_GWF2_36_839]HAT74044.1 hypothetical protein [Candidatus Moranbacteria bacterium]HBY11208.1 hypothetical protein [Candidatus Moranbacteria bacterium]